MRRSHSVVLRAAMIFLLSLLRLNLTVTRLNTLCEECLEMVQKNIYGNHQTFLNNILLKIVCQTLGQEIRRLAVAILKWLYSRNYNSYPAPCYIYLRSHPSIAVLRTLSESLDLQLEVQAF